MITVTMKCKTHPTYKALRAPRTSCLVCRAMYSMRRDASVCGFYPHSVVTIDGEERTHKLGQGVLTVSAPTSGKIEPGMRIVGGGLPEGSTIVGGES